MTRDDIVAVLERVRTWPPSRQQDAARLLLEMEAQGTTGYRLASDERAAIEESREQTRRGDFVNDEEVDALFDRYRG